MLLKHADDKSNRVALLERLLRSGGLAVNQMDWLRQELDRLRKGIQGERDAAQYLDNYLAGDPNRMLLHDLRFSLDGEIAQIDHMVINRAGHLYLLETKCFGGNVRISEHGEFSVNYGEREFGIPSPIEQTRRHERVLAKLLLRIGIGPRIGASIVFHHVVLIHPKATITRPPAKAFDTSMVIKADMFPQWHRKFVDADVGVLDVMAGAANFRSPETIREWGEKLIQQHQPADLLRLPEFVVLPAADQLSSAVNVPASKGDQSLAPNGQEREVELPVQSRAAPKTLMCAQCGSKISFAEGKFCWNNERRFGGVQYCREHQALFK